MKNNTPFEYIKSINNKIPIDKIDNKIYNQFIINKNFSMFNDTIFIINEINMLSNISNQMHYDFLYNLIDKKSRFKKWTKKIQNDDISFISDYYNINYDKAYQLSKVFTDDFIKNLKNDNRE